MPDRKRKHVRKVGSIFVETFQQWQNDSVGRSAAALAFYMVFSLAPSLMFVVAVAGLFAGNLAARTELFRQVQTFIGPRAAEFLQLISEGAREGSGLSSTAIGIGVAFLGATAVFAELQDSLNHIWGVEAKPGRFWKRLVYTRVVSFLIVLGVGLLLVIALGVGAFLAIAEERLGQVVPLPAGLTHNTSLIVSFLLMVAFFTAIYKILPDVQIAWKDVWVGATITAVFLAIGRFLISLYLARSTLRSVYGAAGSLVIILLWVYYSAQIFLFGAEFTQVYARRYGSVIRPSRDARWVREEPGSAKSPAKEKAARARGTDA